MKKLLLVAIFLFVSIVSISQKSNRTPYGEKCWILWKFLNAEDTVAVVILEDDLQKSDYDILKRLKSMSLADIKKQATKWTNAGKRVETFPYRKEDFEEEFR